MRVIREFRKRVTQGEKIRGSPAKQESLEGRSDSSAKPLCDVQSERKEKRGGSEKQCVRPRAVWPINIRHQRLDRKVEPALLPSAGELIFTHRARKTWR